MQRSPFSVLSVCLLLATAAAQTTVQIQCRKDNSMWGLSGTQSNGAGSHLFVGMDGLGRERRALVSFDIAGSVPAGSRVTDVSLSLYCSRWNGASPLRVHLHRALSDWGEGTSNASGQEGTGATATTNDTTWLHRFYPNTLWTTPGGDHAAGSSGWSDTVFQGNTFRGAGMVADVQSWLDGPAANFGWLLKTASPNGYDVRRFDTRESVSNRPVLTVRFLPPGTGATFGSGCHGSTHQLLTLTVLGAPVGGTAMQLLVGGGQGGALMANALALDYSQGVPLYPACNVYLAPLGLIATYNFGVLTPAGSNATPLPVPVGLRGLFIAAQSAALDQALPAGYVLSNAWLGVLQ
jgi:hypothetical protein